MVAAPLRSLLRRLARSDDGRPAAPRCRPRVEVLEDRTTPSGLQISPSPTVNHSFLNATAAVAANNIWAVGGSGLIEHFDGSKWSVVPSPNSGANLYSVSGSSASDVWAVGSVGRHPSVAVMHFDGTSWSNVSAPSPAFDSQLRSVVDLGPNNVWAVGVSGSGPTQTLIEHWDGTSWSVVPSPNVGGTSFNANNALTGVAAVSANDIWAVGYSTDPSTGFQRTLAEQWNGSSWSVVPSADATSGHNVLNGVAATSTDVVMAVGYATDTSGKTNGLILHN